MSLQDLLEILVKISQNSLYAIQNDINNSFVTIFGGHRVGICGEVVLKDGKVKNIKNINSMNIKVARQMIGCADKLLPIVIDNLDSNMNRIIFRFERKINQGKSSNILITAD